MEQSASSQFFFQDRVGYDSSQSPSGTVTRHVGASNFYMHKDSMDEGSPGSPDSPSSGYRDMQQNSRFPFLKDFCHIHYEHVEPLVLQCELVEEAGKQLSVSVKANSLAWVIHRSWDQVKLLDQKLHHCIYERARSALPDLSQSIVLSQVAIRELVGSYFQRFSNLAHSTINCGTVLNWFEVDNRGNHLIELASTSSSVSFINIPAVAAAQAIREYEAQAPDELSLGFAEYVSVIDMPPPSESKWWRGKKAFQVGLFPSDCVELIQCSKDPAGGTSIRNPTREPPPPSPENMKAVYRKRGKLITTLRNMFNTRLTRSELKNRGIIRERVFGCDLGEYLGNANIPIPYVLNFCAIFIETRCMVDGVYRLTGVYNRVIELRGEFDAGTVTEDTTIAEMDIHAVTAVLKLYFRELPVPLLTTSLYDAFNFAINVSAPSRLAAVKKVVDQLRPPHKRTAKYLFRHLHRMAQHQATTSMGTSNLAVIWGPNLLRCKEDQEGGLSYSILNSTRVATLVTEYLIRHAHQIFSDSPDSTDQIPGRSRENEGYLVSVPVRAAAVVCPTVVPSAGIPSEVVPSAGIPSEVVPSAAMSSVIEPSEISSCNVNSSVSESAAAVSSADYSVLKWQAAVRSSIVSVQLISSSPLPVAAACAPLSPAPLTPSVSPALSSGNALGHTEMECINPLSRAELTRGGSPLPSAAACTPIPTHLPKSPVSPLGGAFGFAEMAFNNPLSRAALTQGGKTGNRSTLPVCKDNMDVGANGDRFGGINIVNKSGVGADTAMDRVNSSRSNFTGEAKYGHSVATLGVGPDRGFVQPIEKYRYGKKESFSNNNVSPTFSPKNRNSGRSGHGEVPWEAVQSAEDLKHGERLAADDESNSSGCAEAGRLGAVTCGRDRLPHSTLLVDGHSIQLLGGEFLI